MRRRSRIAVFSATVAALAFVTLSATHASAATFSSDWASDVTRPWLGAHYWATGLEHWRLRDGRVECIRAGEPREVHLLTHQLEAGAGDLRVAVRLGWGGDPGALEELAGFKVAALGGENEYRANILHERAVTAGVTSTGRLVLGEQRSDQVLTADQLDDIKLVLAGESQDDGFAATLKVFTGDGSGEPIATVSATLEQQPMAGNVALACERMSEDDDVPSSRSNEPVWFRDWSVSGSKVTANPGQRFGPIFWSMYTLERGTLKLTALMAPVGEEANRTVHLEAKRDGSWRRIDTAQIDPLARTARFRVSDWDGSRDQPYRVRYEFEGRTHTWRGTVRREPVDQNTVTVAALGCYGDQGFPHHHLHPNLRKQQPDLLFFSGDQIYEGNGGYGPVWAHEASEVERGMLNYLPKFWMLGWAHRDLMKNRPTVMIPDDHDMYSNDLWGRGGAPMTGGWVSGGYHMHPDWINAVERTQMSHLPDPVAPDAAKRSLKARFTDLRYGRISFAIVEDRKFKSAPEQALDEPIGHDEPGRLDEIVEPYDPARIDEPELTLVGERQLAFLKNWSTSWAGVDMKSVLHQSPWAQPHQSYGGVVADMDSNGWPQSGRDRALRAIRKGFPVMINGDLHMPTLLQLGVDNYRDGPWSYTGPGGSATSLRVWQPDEPGENRLRGMPDYTGDFQDGLDNRMTVWALHDGDARFLRTYRADDGSLLDSRRMRGSGYGLIRFHKPSLQITFESWPLYHRTKDPQRHAQHPGWPRSIAMEQNYAREPVAHLPTLQIDAEEPPAVRVINQASGETVYARRLRDTTARLPVFEKTQHTVVVGEVGTDAVKKLTDVQPGTDGDETISVSLPAAE